MGYEIISENWTKIVVISLISLVLGSIIGLFLPFNHIVGLNSDNSENNKIQNNIENEGNRSQTIPLDIFTSDKYWQSEQNWEVKGINLCQGNISGNKFTLQEGNNFAHIARKYKYRKFDNISVRAEISENNKTNVRLEVCTSNNRVDIAHLNMDSETILDKVRYKVKDGKNLFVPDLSWGKFSFFKITIDRKNVSIPSPKIQNIQVYTSQIS